MKKEITVIVRSIQREVSDEVLRAYDSLISGLKEIFSVLNNAANNRVKLSIVHIGFDRIYRSKFAICVETESSIEKNESEIIECVYDYLHNYIDHLFENSSEKCVFESHVQPIKKICQIALDDVFLGSVQKIENVVRRKFSGLSGLTLEIYRNWNTVSSINIDIDGSDDVVTSSKAPDPDQIDMFVDTNEPKSLAGGSEGKNGLQCDHERLTLGLSATIRKHDITIGLTSGGRPLSTSRSLLASEEICRRVNEALEGVGIYLVVEHKNDGQLLTRTPAECGEVAGA